MLDLIKSYQTVSIIGMAKNVGKTTTLNYILRSCYGNVKIGLTSIGRDGESVDVVTNTSKPRIYVEAGTLIATAKGCLKNSDITKQILQTTAMQTPLGEIVILQALSDGYVDVAGPSFNSQLTEIVKVFKRYGVGLTLIDGALGRKGLAEGYVSEATILCTGASYHAKLDKVVGDTAYVIELLSLDEVKDKSLFTSYIKDAKVSIVNEQGLVNPLPIKSALSGEEAIINALNLTSRFLVIKGALTDKLMNRLIGHRNQLDQLTLVILNGTKCLISHSTYEKMKRAGIALTVLEKTKVIAVTYNPTSVYQNNFDEALFQAKLKEVIDRPLFNVEKEEA